MQLTNNHWPNNCTREQSPRLQSIYIRKNKLRACNMSFVCIIYLFQSRFRRFFESPAWLSPRMRLSSPDHSPLIARTRVLAICSFCRFSSYNTASGRFYQPGETFMTHLTYSGLCCFFFFLSTERIDERYIKAPIAASKCRPTTSEVAWVFS